jgi:hypothetical protein
LFAGFLSAFLIELLGRLEPDPMNIIQDVLIYQTQMMRNSSLEPYVPADFSPPDYIVIVNALFYASLGVMILAAFLAMLIKSWVREFDRGLRAMTIPEQRAKAREFRYLGMERWKLPEMVAILPLLIQISLFLFAVGLVLFLFHVSKPSCGVTTVIFGVGMLFYTMTTSISVFISSSPFHFPLSRTLAKVYQRLHAYLCPHVDVFLSETMDTTPATALGRFRRHIHIFLQKSRPYVEEDFVEPIATTIVDEVQHFTAALALQRIHESAPKSQHSEALQWSVWQVAGSPTLRIPPLFNIPSWIIDKWDDDEYLSHLPPSMLVAMIATSLRAPRKLNEKEIAALSFATRHVDDPNDPWAQSVIMVLDILMFNTWFYSRVEDRMPKPFYIHIDMIRRKGLRKEESLWLLNTLSEFECEGRLSKQKPSFVGICLAILLGHAPKWDDNNPPDIVLLEAMVTLLAISGSPDKADQRNILTNSRENPWLLLNIRNPNLITTFFVRTRSDNHEQLISLLFLVVYALMHRPSYPLASQYFISITAKGDFPLYASALTAIAPFMSDDGLTTIGRMLVTPRRQELVSVMETSKTIIAINFPEELFKNYDHHLGPSSGPDPNFFAILLILCKQLSSSRTNRLRWGSESLKNPWLRLGARIAVRLDNPDGSGVPTGLFYDHRVHNMIAALSLLRYTERNVTQYTESLLLASFLQSREFAISSLALEYYTKTAISYSDPSAPPCSLSHAVHAVFNLTLPDHQLQKGWPILEIFENGFDNLPVEWRRTFAEAFFTMSRLPLPQLQGGTETSTPETELNKILTWEYFHKEERESEYTDSDFSGLDWMAMAWSLHLSHQSGRMEEGPGQGEARSQPAVNEEFVLRALCKLLDAAPSAQVIPNIPQLREFVHWFDDTGLPESCNMISARIEEAIRRHQEFYKFHKLHKFHKFHCTWYI